MGHYECYQCNKNFAYCKCPDTSPLDNKSMERILNDQINIILMEIIPGYQEEIKRLRKKLKELRKDLEKLKRSNKNDKN